MKGLVPWLYSKFYPVVLVLELFLILSIENTYETFIISKTRVIFF